MSGRDSQVGNNFLSDVFSSADPNPFADMLARYDALRQRVTVLERAIERSLVFFEEDRPVYGIRALKKALDG